MPSTAFRRRNGYEDLDKCNQSSEERLSNKVYAESQTLSQQNRQQKHIFSISDTTLNFTPTPNLKPQNRPSSVLTQQQSPSHCPPGNQSTLSIGNGISLGSIVLLPSRALSAAEDCGDAAMHSCTSINLEHCATNHGSAAAKKWGCVLKQNVRLLCFALFYCVYLAIGSVCFQIVETPVEEELRKAVRLLRANFLQKYPQISDEDLEEFLNAVITANDRGISPLRNATNEMNWSFGQAFFFSSTVITTIGYGHVTPLSQTGKIFCIIYAAIGIPLTLVLLSAMVERLLVPASWLLGTLNSKLGHLYQPFNIRLLHLSIVAIIVIIVFFAIPTAIFAYIEPTWGVLDAFYYCFISLTTIGLGDYIPGDGVTIDNRSMYKIFISSYLICGLIAMMFVLTIFYDIPQLNLGQLFTESTNGETEKLRLSSNNTTCYSGPSGLYMPHRDEDTRRAIVRIRPHGDDSPSPDEAPSSLNSDMRVP
ncbi:potassium channel subfamily K member 1-like isoform X1 [Anastrepha obliqua]|uniref:potassium channel subfamily K member 1-like isoform X1 n=1 Tax=Anastrepha obliqua TaxID=95512 RepID=UPI0024090747|nr:potassium channel subfamily K member 1-like isoform X1 [Anastrepha obliqua]